MEAKQRRLLKALQVGMRLDSLLGQLLVVLVFAVGLLTFSTAHTDIG